MVEAAAGATRLYGASLPPNKVGPQVRVAILITDWPKRGFDSALRETLFVWPSLDFLVACCILHHIF